MTRRRRVSGILVGVIALAALALLAVCGAWGAGTPPERTVTVTVTSIVPSATSTLPPNDTPTSTPTLVSSPSPTPQPTRTSTPEPVTPSATAGPTATPVVCCLPDTGSGGILPNATKEPER